jgi:hypothetical protein
MYISRCFCGHMETVFLLVYMYEVVKMLGGSLSCVQYYLVLTGTSIYVYYIRSGRKADCLVCPIVMFSPTKFQMLSFRQNSVPNLSYSVLTFTSVRNNV